MAGLLWGRVFYHETFAGYLREEPGDRYFFAYDDNYLNANLPPIAHTLPLRSEPYFSQSCLHPFFDNLVAEGWLETVQSRTLGLRSASRFNLLLAFGYDCIGAVSITNSEYKTPNSSLLDWDEKERAVITSRASLSGVQPKLALVSENGKFRPAHIGELSTHIGKFVSRTHDDLVINEYLTMSAYKHLVPNDTAVDLEIGNIDGISELALIIKRFDRSENNEKIHFEELNQLLGKRSQDKYDGDYADIANFIKNTPGCLNAEIYRLYQRIIAGFLLGNTDMHLKNFAMFHTNSGLRLTPVYDYVAAVLYGYKDIALGVLGDINKPLGTLKAKHIIGLGESFNLSRETIRMAWEELYKNKDSALESIHSNQHGTQALKNNLIDTVNKRWKGTYSLIGNVLLTKA